MASKDKLPAGKHTVAVDFTYDGGGIGKGGTATLTVDGQKPGSFNLDRVMEAVTRGAGDK